MSKATEDLLGALHGLLAEEMQKKLASGDVTASDLNVIRQFLKDNGINSDGTSNPTVQRLVASLPDLDEGEEAYAH